MNINTNPSKSIAIYIYVNWNTYCTLHVRTLLLFPFSSKIKIWFGQSLLSSSRIKIGYILSIKLTTNWHHVLQLTRLIKWLLLMASKTWIYVKYISWRNVGLLLVKSAIIYIKWANIYWPSIIILWEGSLWYMMLICCQFDDEI